MSSIDDLRDVACLSGLASFDQDEEDYHRRISAQFTVTGLALQDYIADPGFGGASGDAATGWASWLKQSVQDVEHDLVTWWESEATARAAMREAASHLGEVEAMMLQAGSMALTKGGMDAAIALAAQAEALAAQYLNIMNTTVQKCVRRGDGGQTSDPSGGGMVYEPGPDTGGTENGPGSGSGLPDGGLPPGRVPTPPVPPPVPPTPVPPHPAPPPPPPPDPPDRIPGRGYDPPNGPGGMVLPGAAAVAAAIALGSGGVGSLAGFRGLSGVVPPGGVVTPTGWGTRIGATPTTPLQTPTTSGQPGGGMGMAPPMGGGGGGQTGSKRKRGDYRVQHLDNPTDAPPDPGWGAQAGTVETMPPAPEPVEDDW